MRKILEFVKKHAQLILGLLSAVSIITAIVLITMMSGIFISDMMIMQSYKKLDTSFDEYCELIRQIQAIYDSNDVNEEEFSLDNALSAYVIGLGDKYAVYKSPDTASAYALNSEGQNIGIGVNVSYNNARGYVIGHVHKGSGADKAGLVTGDIIIDVNGNNYSDIEYSEFMSLLKGEIGDTVHIKVLRDVTILEFDIAISLYDTEYVYYRIVDGIPVIRVESFTLVTDEQFIEIMNDLEDRYDKFIIDMRSNTGGYAESAANMVDYCVGKGVITELTNKRGLVLERYKSDAHEVDGKFIILTNGTTASASELFTQSMIDFDKAETVGTKTYGKGTTLSTQQLPNGGTFTYSSGVYSTKSGTIIEGVGIEPTYKVEFPSSVIKTLYELTDEDDIQLRKAIEVLNGK